MRTTGTRLGGWLAVYALALSGCAFDPPMKADHASATYRTDLRACQKSAHKAANAHVLSRGILFLTYPVSLPIVQRARTRQCLEAKGYTRRD